MGRAGGEYGAASPQGDAPTHPIEDPGFLSTILAGMSNLFGIKLRLSPGS